MASLGASLIVGACAGEPIVERDIREDGAFVFSDEPIVARGPLENGPIVFAGVSDPGDPGPVQLYSMEEDGTDVRQLTDDSNYKTAVASSPDGSRIAYAAFDDELTESSPSPEPSSIFLVEADGSDRSVLCDRCARTAYAFEQDPFDDVAGDEGEFSVVPNSLAWSPGGSTIAVPAVTPGVLLIDVRTGETATIATPEPVTAIAWAPDGRRLALSHTYFSSLYGTSRGIRVPDEGTELEREPVEIPGGIYVLDLETDRLDEVVSSPGLAHVHGWSAEGDRILFAHVLDETKTGEISVYSVSGDRTWTVVPGGQGAAPLGVGWSPSGDSIAALVDQYDRESQLAKDLWVTPATDVELRSLPICHFEGAFDGDNCAQPAMVWSPDGAMVAYRAMLHGTPVRSAVILQGIDGSATDVVEIDAGSFYGGENSCCFLWLPRPD